MSIPFLPLPIGSNVEETARGDTGVLLQELSVLIEEVEDAAWDDTNALLKELLVLIVRGDREVDAGEADRRAREMFQAVQRHLNYVENAEERDRLKDSVNAYGRAKREWKMETALYEGVEKDVLEVMDDQMNTNTNEGPEVLRGVLENWQRRALELRGQLLLRTRKLREAEALLRQAMHAAAGNIRRAWNRAVQMAPGRH